MLITRALSILLGSEPPSEFRIFKAGLNPTENGYAVLFDDEAARTVIAAAATWGVRLMVDLEHESLEQGPAVRPDQKDARGWFSLEVRNGELWAANVQWTPDGARRLTEKTQAYVSPGFLTQKVEGREGVERITEIRNMALCAMPATRDAMPLVAASRKRMASATVAPRNASASFRKANMDPEKIKAIIEALKNGDGNAALAACEEILAGLASGGGAAPGAPAEPAEMTADPSGEAPDAPKDKPAAAALTRALAIAEKASTDLTSALARLSVLENDAGARDAKERGALVAELVKLEAETPATAFEKDANGAPTAKLCKRLSSEPVADMRARVEALRSDPKRASRIVPEPETPSAAAPLVLTPEQKKLAKSKGLTDAEFIERRAKSLRVKPLRA